MRKPNDLSRSLSVLNRNSTLIAVIEMSQSSFCNGPSVVNPSFALSDRRALASVRGRREAAT